jgi:hypothetical protein
MWKPLESFSKKEISEFEHRFRKKARFLVDENVDVGVSDAINELGWNSVTVGEVGLIGHSDEGVFAFAWNEDRMILTHDKDFLDNQRFPFHRNPGLFVLPGEQGQGDYRDRAVALILLYVAPYQDIYRGIKGWFSEDMVWTSTHFNRQQGRHIRSKLRLDKSGKALQWIES